MFLLILYIIMFFVVRLYKDSTKCRTLMDRMDYDVKEFFFCSQIEIESEKCNKLL